MNIVSWNVNGLRAAHRKGFGRWLAKAGADVVLLQEVRARPDELPRTLHTPKDWHAAFAPAEKRGYSGVAVYSRTLPDEVRVGLGVERFDVEGRVIGARYGKLWVISAYFPHGGRDLGRVPWKLDFYEVLLRHVEGLRAQGFHVVVSGDYNVAHAEIDLARPKQNVKTSGFRPEEREALDRWVKAGWVDTFRHVHPEARDRYSWWVQYANARKRNIGWRIDYHFVDPALAKSIKDASIHEHVKGSDHCPVGVIVHP